MKTHKYKDKIVSELKKCHLISIANLQKKIGKIDYSTVFRNVEQLVKEGFLKKIVLDKNIVMYELNSKDDNHGHFLCLDCGDVEEVEMPEIKGPSVGKKLVHDVLMKGKCEKCNVTV